MYAKVIVDVPAKATNRAFDYQIPMELIEDIRVGSRVGVPFGPRVLQGFVVELHMTTNMDTTKIKPIRSLLDKAPPLTPELVAIGRWMSEKYICHEVTALQAMLPSALKARYEKQLRVSDNGIDEVQLIKDRAAGKMALSVFPVSSPEELAAAADALSARASKQQEVLRYFAANPLPIRLTKLLAELNVTASAVKSLADKGLLELRNEEVQRDPYADRHFERSEPLKLTEEQFAAFREIRDAVMAKQHQTFLLQGVTGSGKTEVYLQTIQQCLDLGREAIVLVPEISLTPQMVERFKGRFGNLVAVLHSRLSQGERYDEWRKIMRREVKVAIGARSAVFAPFTDIGLIIIDEEHESSYKQEESPKYHATEVAIERARRLGAAVVLGSATPSLESMYKASIHHHASCLPYRKLNMPTRVAGRPMPPVQVVDMREELKKGNRSMFSGPLYKAIEERLLRKEQTVLLLNRRGYATFVMCRSCGYVAQCPHCDISLTYHQSARNLRCHYCGYAEREKSECPECQSTHIRHFGTGTQRVEEELAKLFPGIRVIRMDVDTTTEKGSHEKWLTMFRNKQADVLLGTQMVAKGLDFPEVTLVGVIAADTVLNLPDFRSAERTFQLLTQVAGRAGRHTLPGEVFVQTYTPEHYSIVAASYHDYDSFARQELQLRQEHSYPPFHRLILITLSHEQIPFLMRTAENLVHRLKELSSSRMGTELGHNENIEVYGPVASPISRIKDRYRFQCMVKYRQSTEVSNWVAQAVSELDELVAKQKLLISIDVDPQMLM
jgi:primosomal protein N' (replication factor Y)